MKMSECGCCENCYKDGFKAGMESYDPNPKLDKAIAEGKEM